MKTRIIVGILLSLMLIALLWFGGFVLLTALSLFAFAAVYETGLAFKNRGFRPWMIAAYVFALLFPFVYYFFGLTVMLVFYVAAVLTVMTVSLLSKRIETRDMMASLFIMVYPAVLLICMVLVYFQFERKLALVSACLAYGAPELADAIAYFAGTLFGKHKLCPEISPKKTVEGSIGALIGGVGFGAIMIPLQTVWGGSVSPVTLLLIGLGCGVFAQLGDLFASSIKRWADMKDFSSLFPGHGGVMDRIDSILFCSAFVLGCFTILSKVSIY